MFIFDHGVYFCILLFWVIGLLLATVLIFISYLFMPQQTNVIKLSAYECGFQPFGEVRVAYDVHFYRIGILFLIFDLELALFLPWSLLTTFSLFQFIVMLVFFVILTLGFVYEWRKGALIWV